jgi:RNA polymerase subunit RPABC4/transcription elongation factor Spt4
MKVQIKCPSCFFKYEGNMDETKESMSCVCPRCGTPFTYRKPKEEEKPAPAEAAPQKAPEEIKNDDLKGMRVCTECGASYDEYLFICPSCGSPREGYSFCPDCNELISDKSKECPNCGSPVNGYSFCPDCDNLIPPGNSSCPKCGCPIEMKFAHIKKQATPAATGKYCPKCHAPVLDSDTICGKCGSPVNGYFYCKECGHIVEPEAEACPQCGCPTNDEAENTYSPQYNEPQQSTPQQDTPQQDIPQQCAAAEETPLNDATDVYTPNDSFEPSQESSTQENYAPAPDFGLQEPEPEPPIETADVTPMKDSTPINDEQPDEELGNDQPPILPEMPMDTEEEDTRRPKTRMIITIIVVGIALIAGMFLFFSKCTGHSTKSVANSTDSTMVDSTKIIDGSVIPLWLVGQWTGSFTDKSMGQFTVLIIIDKSGNWTQMITPDGKRGNSEVGKITVYTPKQFKVLYDGDKSKTSFAVNEKRRTFSLGKNYWLSKK